MKKMFWLFKSLEMNVFLRGIKAKRISLYFIKIQLTCLPFPLWKANGSKKYC